MYTEKIIFFLFVIFSFPINVKTFALNYDYDCKTKYYNHKREIYCGKMSDPAITTTSHFLLSVATFTALNRHSPIGLLTQVRELGNRHLNIIIYIYLNINAY